MKPDLEREEALFSEALQRLPEEWKDFLDRACGGDRQMQDRLTALLVLHSRSGDFLEKQDDASVAEALGHALLADELAGLTGTQIGAYIVKERLGEGGVGVVYRAEQTEPIRREVALKVIKPGMDTREVLLRFSAERQALAVMDHPGIARVIEAGSTAQGRPFFAMELVRGVPLTHHCDAHRLPLGARLELFRRVCEAVQHAHQKGIIHRDLKPSNILVVEGPHGSQPKIIDFGIAKATTGSGGAEPAVTAVAHFIGTPAYMSPEQAAGGLDLDTRSDIYSLGVLLHELLTGAPPFEARVLQPGGVEDLRRRIIEDEPARPSLGVRRREAATRQAVAAVRGVEPARLAAQLEGELDWIILRCLEKDRGRRYATAHDLAEDVRRHLQDEPVFAAAPGRLYRFRKSLRRHRVAYAAGALVFAALAGATAVSSWQAVRARRAERVAEAAKKTAAAEAASSAAISAFLRTDLLAQASPDNQPDRDVKLRTVVDRAAARLGTRFATQPLVEADLRETLGDTYQALGEVAAAQAQFEAGHALLRQSHGADHLDTLRVAVKLYDVLPVSAKLEATETLGRDTLDHLIRTVGMDHPLTLQLRVSLYKIMYRGRYTEAEPLLRASLEDARRVLGTDNPVTLSAMSDYAVVLAELERLDEAAVVAEEALSHLRRVHGAEHPQTLPTMSRLAAMYGHMERYAQARALAEQLLAVRTKLLGADHPQTLMGATVLAGILVGSHAYAEAEPLIHTTIEALRQKTGADHPAALNLAIQLAMIRFDERRLDEADALLAGTLDQLQKKFGPGYSDTVNAAVLRGRIAAARRDWVAASSFLEPAIVAARATIGPSARITLSAVYEQAGVMAGSGRHADAEPLYREVYEQRRARFGSQQPDTLAAAGALGRVLAALGRPAEAESLLLAWHDGLVNLSAAELPADNRIAELAESRAQLAALYEATGRPADAARWRR